MLTLDDDETEVALMALKVCHAAASKLADSETAYLASKYVRLIERIEQLQEDRRNGDA